MRKIGLIIIIILFAISGEAQQIKQEVIASAGGYNVSADGGISISWTLGETIIPTFKSQDGSLILTHGFQQKLIITTVDENIETPVNVTIFPNPTSEIINIQFEIPTDTEIEVYMLDGQGRLVMTDNIGVAEIYKMLNIQDLPAGIYYLRLVSGKLVNIYKVVKL
jgi:hypothetical protein